MNASKFRGIGYFCAVLIFGAVGCGEQSKEQGVEPAEQGPTPTSAEEAEKLSQEAPVGQPEEPPVPEDDKADDFDYERVGGDHSEQCKPIPDLAPLNDPVAVISLDGLSFHLWDNEGDYDKVFPIGVGKVEDGQNLTPTSEEQYNDYFYLRADEPAVEDNKDPDYRRWAWNYSCRFWSGKKYYNEAAEEEQYRSYFAGLPFIRFEGPPVAAYGIHGPITEYWTKDGGTLRRGYVSLGCVRMASEDIREVFARIKGHKTPLKIQKEPELREDGLFVNPDRFMNASCKVDSDCAGSRSVCVDRPVGEGRFCTQPCRSNDHCPNRDGGDSVSTPSRQSHCVPSSIESIDTEGVCLTAASTTANQNCGRFGERFEASELPLLNDPLTNVSVCVPDKRAWFGSGCGDDGDCALGQCINTEDGRGFCSTPCYKFCPDREGEPLSRCVQSIDGRYWGGNCTPTCDTDADCSAGQSCTERSYYGRDGSDQVCVPDGRMISF